MVEQDQTPLPNKTLKEARIAEASLGEGIRDDGDSSSGLDSITTPFVGLLTYVGQETFVELRKRDSMAALRLFSESKSSILTQAQGTPR